MSSSSNCGSNGEPKEVNNGKINEPDLGMGTANKDKEEMRTESESGAVAVAVAVA
eukprot:CAMPEP_0202465068 /NCGR_PEP_ID=MMETSP1360-20130828/64225_1 /ASSEMBLY_ACC=CAM_ASM_000848 /TAXON_ID=515479 /ORGANISM="Licmophora paradoxa, Strain CCMP2313" /LENGTH=54 /DNA_ID=CAMNT_0049088631 /DNA_START=33 /DNA_END=194 /DNA_ORIENTATION=-